MKRWLVLAVAAITIAGFSTVSFAAISGSHHDLAAFTANNEKDACYACHGFKSDAGSINNAGVVGTLCYLRCHNGTAGAVVLPNLAAALPEYGTFNTTSANLEIRSYTSADPATKYVGGHKFRIGITNIPAPDDDTLATSVANSWPYMTAGTAMECTTCHDVHSNAQTPFLRSALSTGSPSTAFCEQCHYANADGAARWTDYAAGGAPNGSHPSEFLFSTAAATGRTIGTRRGRTILFKDVVGADNNAIFRNISPWGTALNAPTARFNPGGKLGPAAGATTTTNTGIVGCYTCHAIHQPMPAMGGTLPQVTQLIVAAYDNVPQSDLCIGCHGGAAVGTLSSAGGNNVANTANPGITAYFHPVEGNSIPVNVATASATVWTVSTGTFNITVNLDNGGIVPLATNNRLICASCHLNDGNAGVHGGPAGTMLLNAKKATCESCHDSSVNSGLTPNSHHVYGGGTTAGSRYTGTSMGYPTSVTYNPTRSARINDGLQCNDCHMFNDTAHNWN